MEAEEGETSAEAMREIGERHGLFLGESTLESDLLAVGQGRAIGETLIELGTTGPARQCGERLKREEDAESDEVLAHIKAIGKGRFAQRLTGNLVNRADHVPRYIASAIDHLRPRNP